MAMTVTALCLSARMNFLVKRDWRTYTVIAGLLQKVPNPPQLTVIALQCEVESPAMRVRGANASVAWGILFGHRRLHTEAAVRDA